MLRAVNSAQSTNTKPAKDLLWKLGGGPFPYEMYQLFLDDEDETKLSYLSDDHLQKLRKYSNNIQLSEKVFIEIRKRIFKHKSRDSIIVNEIKGIFEFLSSCKKYIKITLDMYRELNGK